MNPIFTYIYKSKLKKKFTNTIFAVWVLWQLATLVFEKYINKTFLNFGTTLANWQLATGNWQLASDVELATGS